MNKGLNRTIKDRLETNGYKVRSLTTHRIPDVGYVTSVLCKYNGHKEVVYLTDGKPGDASVAKTLKRHHDGIPKQGGRMHTRETGPDTTVYSNGNRVYDDDGNRLSKLGGYEIV